MTDSKPRRRPNRLRENREAAGLTQQELADKVGAGRTTIIRAEQGTQAPSLELADELAEVLDTTIDELFSGFDRDGYDAGWSAGRLAEREDRERAERRVKADTQPDAGPRGPQNLGSDRGKTEGVGADTPAAEVAAWIAETAAAKPSAPDLKSIWILDNPRGTQRKLDAVVTVSVQRRGPREAKRLYAETLEAWSVENDTRGDD